MVEACESRVWGKAGDVGAQAVCYEIVSFGIEDWEPGSVNSNDNDGKRAVYITSYLLLSTQSNARLNDVYEEV